MSFSSLSRKGFFCCKIKMMMRVYCGRRNVIESMNKKYPLYGSSFAAAHVSGIAAVIMQQYGIRGYNEVLDILSVPK